MQVLKIKVLKRRSDTINKKLAVLKDLLSMFITQHRNQLSYIIGFLSALAFALVYTKFGIELAVAALLAGILIFEIFDHFFGGSPDIIAVSYTHLTLPTIYSV